MIWGLIVAAIDVNIKYRNCTKMGDCRLVGEGLKGPTMWRGRKWGPRIKKDEEQNKGWYDKINGVCHYGTM